ncbi:hypothetical protein CFC21_076224 [Triticum aestivum]|uniref:Uncharacterized protein n=2 Tax=Triticum aestivum TaxID=4565 RepID=A0A9R1HSM7_WHEAT|nr:hypothetical protein CFC21_076224 [Triticum aestivum]
MKVVRDIEDGELHLASTNEGDLSSCSTLQFLVGVSDSNPGSGVRRQRLDAIVTLAVAALAFNEKGRRNQIGASKPMRQGRELAGPLVGEVWSWYYVDSEGARLKGSIRFCSSLYANGILDEGYKFNMSVEEAAELAWRAFITQYSVTELVVVVFLVIC